jgi:uncharacterized phage protein gp47/JayE
MPTYQRPTRETLIERIKGDLGSRTQGAAYLKRSFELILSIVLGGVADGLHSHLDWLRKQISPLTCDIDMLLVWGVLVHVPRKGEVPAAGLVTFPASAGAVMPVDRQVRSDAGVFYKVTAATSASNGVITAPVIAVSGGSAGNIGAGAPLTLVTPVDGVTSRGVVGVDGLTGGDDLEKVERYRERVLSALRQPPKGGGPGDYVKWAKENAGVTRAWEFGRRMGAGTVSVGFVMDDRENIIPQAADVATVLAYIGARAPIDLRQLYVQPPIAVPVNMTVNLRPNTAAVRAAALVELRALFRLSAELERSLPQSEVDEAISIADGEVAHEITAISSLNPGSWGLLTLGTVTFGTL